MTKRELLLDLLADDLPLDAPIVTRDTGQLWNVSKPEQIELVHVTGPEGQHVTWEDGSTDLFRDSRCGVKWTDVKGLVL